MAASLKYKRTPITTPPYQVPSVDVTPDPPIFSLVTTFNTQNPNPPYFSLPSYQLPLILDSPFPPRSHHSRNGYLNSPSLSIYLCPAERVLPVLASMGMYGGATAHKINIEDSIF